MVYIEAWFPHPLTPKVFLSHSSPHPRNYCSHLKNKHKCTLLWILGLEVTDLPLWLRPGHSSPVAPSYGIMGTGLPFMHQLFFDTVINYLINTTQRRVWERIWSFMVGNAGRWNNFSYSGRAIVTTARKREMDSGVLLDNFPLFLPFYSKMLTYLIVMPIFNRVFFAS